MSIVHLPENLQLAAQLYCSICHVRLHLPKATVGLFDANNIQAFACVSHFMEVELLICGWADFVVAERRKYKQQGQAPTGEQV